LPPFAALAWGKRPRAPWKTPALRRLATLLNCSTRGLAGFIEADNRLRYFRDRDMPGERLLDTKSANGHEASLESARQLLPEVFAHHLGNHFLGEFMVKVDGATMHYGLEARAPLLDQELWEFGAALPFALRLRRGRLKAVLREIARRRIGAQVAKRPKRGFTVPVERWLSERWISSLDSLRGDTELVREGWIRREALDAAVAEALTANRVPVQLWYVLVLEHWLGVN
jgi:asparagine synthase (glutamine-hydrolysing)